MPVGKSSLSQRSRIKNRQNGRMYGQYGKDYIKSPAGPLNSDTTPEGVYYDAILFTKQTTVLAITDDELLSGDMTGEVFAAGVVIQGRIKDVTIGPGEDEGAMVGYRSEFQEV